MSGMSGTGSNDFSVDAVFVPDHRAQSLIDFSNDGGEGAALHAHNPLYRMPLVPFLYCEVLGLFSGALRGATAAFEDTIAKRVRTHSRETARDSQYAHILLGEALSKAWVAERLVRDHVRQTEERIAAGGFEMSDRVRLKAHAGFVIDHCRRAANEMVHEAGTTQFHLDSALQRHFRDLNVLSTHAFWDWQISREQYGRFRLGLEPNNPLV